MNSKKENIRDIPYPRGFVLCRGNFEVPEHFDSRKLYDGWILHTSPLAATDRHDGEDGVSITLSGFWYDVCDQDVSNLFVRLSDALSRSRQDFERELDYVGGRFIAIAWKDGKCHLYQDAVGARSVYYRLDDDLITSHFELAQSGGKKSAEVPWRRSRMAMDLTSDESIRQLLPNFRLDLCSREVERFFPRTINSYSEWTHSERLAEITRLWKNSLAKICAEECRVVISITGGIDSRLSIAMAKSWWSEINTFTYGVSRSTGSNYSNVMNRDFEIVRSILATIPELEHEMIDLRTLPSTTTELRNLLDRNSQISHGPRLVQRDRKSVV